jgi:hypothetical protein
MSTTSRRFDQEIDQIESIASTKGIELDDIVVNETTTDDGDELIVFRILETKAESEKDSVGVQVSKMPSVQTGDMAFRNDVTNKLNALKRHLAGNQPSEELDENEDESDSDQTESDTSASTESSLTRTREEFDYEGNGGPGAEIDARLSAIEAQLDDLEARVAAIEDKSEALDGLQKIVGGGDDE